MELFDTGFTKKPAPDVIVYQNTNLTLAYDKQKDGFLCKWPAGFLFR